jgi:hypothetical protein
MVGLLAVWAVSRATALALAIAQLSRATLFSDPNLLWAWANGAAYGSDENPALAEYPGLARLLALSGRLADTPTGFGWGWIAAMLAVDLAILAVLWRSGGTGRGRTGGSGSGHGGAWLWAVGGAALGPVMWLRYDLLVALLALVAVVQRDRRPAWSGIALGVAVLLKLWPLVLVAALLPRHSWRLWSAAAGATIAGGVLAEALLRGASSTLTPLTYQGDRGIQIESLFATPVLLASRDEPGRDVWEFAFRSFQLQGSDGTTATIVGVTVLAVAGLAVLALVQRSAPGRLADVRSIGAALLAVLVVATNSVFSPQYVMWFLPLVALVVVRVGGVALSVTAVAIAGLTQAIWPWGYTDLLAMQPWALGALTLRNVLVVVLVVLLAVRMAAVVRPRSTPDEQAAGSASGPPGQPVTNDSRT